MKLCAWPCVLVSLLLSPVSAALFFAGVAESGGEFGVWSDQAVRGTGLPGRFGVDYAFINESTVDVFVDTHGVNLFRVAFLLERLCPPGTPASAAGPGRGLGAVFNETHFALLKQAVDYITRTKGAYCILDPHNYMRYNDPSHQPMSGSVIGNASDPAAATTAQFAAFWGALAGRFADNEKVLFGLMNEPHDMPSALLLANLQAAVDAIRNTSSASSAPASSLGSSADPVASNLIIAPGNAWTGGHAWTQGGAEASALWLGRLHDPLNNTAIDIHEYLDVDYSGSHAACAAEPAANLDAVTAWLRQQRLKAFVTEFGASNATVCGPMLARMLAYMAEHSDAYLGWTAWAAGPLWGTSSPCCSDGAHWGSLEPGSAADGGQPGLYETVWKETIQAGVPAKLQWTGPARVSSGEEVLTERKRG